ncbi:phosphotransferase family protein [Marinibaculum pumilum]|uniref:Phosphotransferase family protein n=1 Tax=Marinibaculum pumilum TaxID=1766165 RepID=A0ABV7L777_9PROT
MSILDDTITSPTHVAARLPALCRRALGGSGEVRGLARLTGGATKATWRLEAEGAEGWRKLILQQSVDPPRAPDDPKSAMPRVVGDEDAAVMLAAASAGVPVPPLRATLTPEDGLGRGYLVDLVPGEASGRKIVAAPDFAGVRPRLAAQYGEIVGRIQQVDITAPALAFLQPFGPRETLASYRAVYDYYDHPHPAIALGLKWAEAHLPPPQPPVLVHGDYRNGNVMVDPGGVTAVLDWELAHTGDPMEDLGWLCVNSWRYGGDGPVGGFGAREDLFAGYERGAGRPADPEVVRFWEVFGHVRWAIMCMMKGESHASRHGGERTMEAFAIGRRTEEPLFDLIRDLTGQAA